MRPSDTLTPREREVIDLVTLGMTNRQIAARMDANYYTVKKWLHAIYEKLGFNNHLEVALWRLSRGNNDART